MNILFKKKQYGAVLPISLIILLLMTLIGVTGSQITGISEKIANNLQDRDAAFQASETALIAAEQYLRDQKSEPDFNACGLKGLYAKAPDPGSFNTNNNCSTTSATPPQANDNWNDSKFSSFSYNWNYDPISQIAPTAIAPKFVIQILGSEVQDASDPNAALTFYQITAKASGKSSDSVVVLQSTFAWKY